MNLTGKIQEIYAKKVPKKVKKNKLVKSFKHIYRKILTLGAKKYPYPDKTVLDYDWDYLVIIDACRHDLFEEVYGKTDYIISQGSCTEEWFNRTFENKNYDLIYISSTPHTSGLMLEKLEKDKVSFFKLEPVWDYGWDEKLETVPPEEVTEKALELAEKYPEKKMIIHYIQPHHPFIGQKEINKSLRKNDKTVWELLKLNKIEKERVWGAYKSNLKLIMNYVDKLRKKLNGKIILTSDHGNLMGKYGLYAHPTGLRVKELVKVPFVVLRDRKEEIKNIEV